jgi:dynein heavy chain
LVPPGPRGFKAPPPTTYGNYLRHIELHMGRETPLALGLHPNAEFGLASTESARLRATVGGVLGVGAGTARRRLGNGGGAAKAHVAESAMQDVLEVYRGVEPFDVERLEKIAAAGGTQGRGPKRKGVSAVDVFWARECGRANRVVRAIVSSCERLEQSFAGERAMDAGAEALVDCLYRGRVPAAWARAAGYPSLRPLSGWIADLNRRLGELQSLADARLAPAACVWLPGVFAPLGLFTALLQDRAKRPGQSLEQLALDTVVQKKQREDLTQPSRDGMFVDGLALVGARWDGSRATLETSRPGALFCALPVVKLGAAFRGALESRGNVFPAPMYRTQMRGAKVGVLYARSKARAEKWTLAGVACLLDTAEAWEAQEGV